ncbi:MAG: YitT family protein [Lachnospiraceae bacterium]|nr:YitT family protein [Lachnospiraceae bacterium]
MKLRPAWMDYILIMAGTSLMALAIKGIFDPVSLVTGGFSGIAIIVKNITEGIIEGGIPLWLTNLFLNIPLFVVAIKVKGWRYIAKTIFATIWLSVALWYMPEKNLMPDDIFLASVFGGVISGLGIGLVLMANATTGGTDTMAAIIQHFIRHYSIAQIMQVLDGVIVLAGAWVFGINRALYAIICIYLVSKVSDGILEGLKFSKLAYIISEHYEEIAKQIMKELDRGATGLDAVGMYSGEKKEVLFCVVSKKEIVKVKDIVRRIDADAFMIVSDVREVFGEGFIEEHQ